MISIVDDEPVGVTRVAEFEELRLSPLEQAVFVLRDVFDFGFAEIAAAVGRSEPACRRLAVRARCHMQAGRRQGRAE